MSEKTSKKMTFKSYLIWSCSVSIGVAFLIGWIIASIFKSPYLMTAGWTGLITLGLFTSVYIWEEKVSPDLQHALQIAGVVYLAYILFIMGPMLGGGRDNEAVAEVSPVGSYGATKEVNVSASNGGSITSPITVRREYIIHYIDFEDGADGFTDKKCRISQSEGGICESNSGLKYFIKIVDFHTPSREDG